MTATTRRCPHLTALFALGLVVLLLAVVDLHTPLRPVLTLLFFALGPGAALVPRLHVEADFLMEASLAVAISVVVSMAVAQAMVWTGVFSPVAAVVLLLALVATTPSPRLPEEVSR